MKKKFFLRDLLIDLKAFFLMKGGLGWRWRLFILFVLVFPIFIGSFFGYQSTFHALTDIALERKRSMADLGAALVYEKLSQFRTLAISLAIRPLLVERINRGDWEGAIQVLQDVPRAFPFIDRIFLADPGSFIRADLPHLGEAVGTSRKETDWYKGVSRNWQPYICEVFYRRSTPRRNVVDIAIPIRSDLRSSDPSTEVAGQGQVVGILILQIQLEKFAVIVKDLGFAQDEILYIVDHKGHVVYHPQFAPQGDIVDFSSVPIVRELLQGGTGVKENYNPVEKQWRLAAFKQVNEFGWGVVFTQPLKYAYAKRDRIIFRLGLLYGGLSFLGFLSALLILHFLAVQRRTSTEISDLYNGAPCGYHSLDKDGVFLHVNDTELSWLGYSREELLGKKKFPDILTPGSRESFHQVFPHFKEVGQVKDLVFEIIRKDSTVFPVILNATAVKDLTGKFLRSRATLFDITERKQAEESLKKAYDDLKILQDQLIQSEKMASVGELAAGVAHEINNPISFITSNLEVLGGYVGAYQKMVQLTQKLHGAVERMSLEEAKVFLAEIRAYEAEINFEYMVRDVNMLVKQSREGVDRIGAIIADLRTFEREETHWLEESVDCEKVLDRVLAFVQAQDKRQVEVLKDYGAVPLVRFDAEKVERVFVNLIKNAMQAISGNGIIEVKTYTRSGHIYVEIRDTGCGISPENLKRVFDPFFSTKSVEKGIGLGLSISYELVKKQGGEIRVVSEVGKGSTFTVVLPLPSGKMDKKA